MPIGWIYCSIRKLSRLKSKSKLHRITSSIIARIFGFTAKTLFNVDTPEARQNVKVDFGKES